jgi:hypothetical protein
LLQAEETLVKEFSVMAKAYNCQCLIIIIACISVTIMSIQKRIPNLFDNLLSSFIR